MSGTTKLDFIMEAVSNILEASSVLTEEVAASEQHLRKSLIEKYMSQRIHSSEILKLSFKSGKSSQSKQSTDVSFRLVEYSHYISWKRHLTLFVGTCQIG